MFPITQGANMFFQKKDGTAWAHGPLSQLLHVNSKLGVGPNCWNLTAASWRINEHSFSPEGEEGETDTEGLENGYAPS